MVLQAADVRIEGVDTAAAVVEDTATAAEEAVADKEAVRAVNTAVVTVLEADRTVDSRNCFEVDMQLLVMAGFVFGALQYLQPRSNRDRRTH